MTLFLEKDNFGTRNRLAAKCPRLALLVILIKNEFLHCKIRLISHAANLTNDDDNYMSMSAASLRSGEVFRAISAAAGSSLILLANHLR